MRQMPKPEMRFEWRTNLKGEGKAMNQRISSFTNQTQILKRSLME